MHSLPPTAGIGLKAEHYASLLTQPQATGWLEVHPENYMGDGGPPHRYLSKLREDYPLSMHGVGMSLGSEDGLNPEHLRRLKALVDRYQPEHVSEHLSWSHWNSIHLNDLLPLPYTQETLALVCRHVDQLQNTLGRRILLENPSTYIDFKHSDYSETDFFAELVARCDCQLLLDINNVFVCAYNNDFDARHYLRAFPRQAVQQIHLAGHSLVPLHGDKQIRIDDHGSAVKEAVWALYREFFALEPRAIATLIEWDSAIPPLETLLAQAQRANDEMHQGLKAHTGRQP